MSTKFKIGDRVKAPGFGEGVIIEIDSRDEYPVVVDFDSDQDGDIERFTVVGKLHPWHPEPLLEKIERLSAEEVVGNAIDKYIAIESRINKELLLSEFIVKALKEAGYLASEDLK